MTAGTIEADVVVIGGGGAGLVAAAEAAAQGARVVLLEGHGHHLGWAFISGRMAGRSAARDRAMAAPVVAAAN